MQTLAQYLSDAHLTQAQFAVKVCTTSATVSRWCSGKAFPNREAIRRIDEVTGGKVPPAVWFRATSGEFVASASGPGEAA